MTAASNSEARKRAAEAASNSESGALATNSPNRGDDTSETANGPQNATQRVRDLIALEVASAEGVDSGAIGRLNEAERAAATAGLDYLVDLARGHDYADSDRINEAADAVADALDAFRVRHEGDDNAAIVREHTDRALAEVEQRLAKAWDEGYEKALWVIDRGMTPYEGMANPYRAERQEQA